MTGFVKSAILAGLLLWVAAGLTGCLSVAPDDSDQPWNVVSPNEGIPTIPGMQP
jgi:hypothetical protein